MWFAMNGAGLSKYDGVTFTRLTTANGLPDDDCYELLVDRNGNLWIAMLGIGICRYDGRTFQTFTQKDGLPVNLIEKIFEDSRGNLWFSLMSGGVAQFDGRNFQILTTKDGLLSNNVYNVLEDGSGNLIFGTGSGITIYTPPVEKVPPPVAVTEVAADKVYPVEPSEGSKPSEGFKIPSTAKHIRFAYHGISFKTKRLRYNYKLEGYDKDWQAMWDAEASYNNLKAGKYTFKVIAITRDLVYSETPATVRLTIVPPFYLRAGFLVPTVGGGTILLVVLVVQAVVLYKRRRQVHAYQQEAVAELRDAREMQLSLLPKDAPQIEGFDIAGACEPATDVGGDYFTYLWLDEAKTPLGIVLMDVTGHGMKAAATTFLANGMLQSESQHTQSPDEIMAKMHQSLRETLPKLSFVAMSFAVMDCPQKTLTHFNAGLPEPILLRKGKPVELPIQSGVPLGCRLPAEYLGATVPLQTGDVLLLFSDGLTEAKDSCEQMYEEVRLGGVLDSLAAQPSSAQAWVDAIRSDVRAFTGASGLADDLTVVVVRVL